MPVKQNRAGAALAVIATLLCPGEPKGVPQRIEQGRADFNRDAVDPDR